MNKINNSGLIKMTKWGRKKTCQTMSSSSSSSSISNVFLKLWLSRFKSTKGSVEHQPEPETGDTRTKVNKISANEGRFYGRENHDDDGFYWRLSFDKESDESGKILCNSDDKLNVSPVEYSSRRRSNTIREEYVIKDSNLEEECEKLKSMKINEIMSKGHSQRKSVHIRRETQRRRSKHGRKVKAYSPRTLAKAECKIKALEDLKKTWMKTKETNKERVIEDTFRTGLDSFAIVKSSYDPQQDFRDSMIEMITEKEIRQAEELEELLACYLTLNCDEYHDLIVKVFRQVWFELNQHHFPISI